MPQSAVPDLNNAIVAYRSMLQNGLVWRDPALIVRAVSILNGCLDDDMKLSMIPWHEYQTSAAPSKAVECPHCPPVDGEPVAHDVKQVVQRESRLPAAFRQVLAEQQVYRVLVCPATGKDIYLDDAETVTVSMPHNAYASEAVVPEPPPHYTVADRAIHGHDFEQWATLVASIIEDRCRQFRNKYRVDAGKDDDTGGGEN